MLADLDVEEPNASIFLKTQQVKSIEALVYRPQWREDRCIFCGKCQTYCAFNAISALPKYVIVFPELCHSCYACSDLCPAAALPMFPVRIGSISICRAEAGLTFFEGKLDIGQEIASVMVRQTRDKALQEAAQAALQWIIFDAPPGAACASREALLKSDAVILIAESTPFGLHDVGMVYRLAKEHQRPCALVVNKDSPGYEGIEHFAQRESIPIIARIPFDPSLAQFYSEGELSIGAFPALASAIRSVVVWLEHVSEKRKENPT